MQSAQETPTTTRDPALGPYARVSPTAGDLVVGTLVRFLAFVVRVLPRFMAYALADLLTPLLVLFTRLHERRVRKKGRGLVRNLEIVFRDTLTAAHTQRMLWGYARHMTHSFVDFFRIPKLTPKTIARDVEAGDVQILEDLHAEGKGVIVVSGHLGALELSGAVPAVLGLPSTCVARPADNPLIRRLLRQIRATTGMELVYKFGALWPLLKALRAGRCVGLSADENVQHKPIFVPFLGTLAATHAMPALLQRRTGAPIAVVSCHRTERGRYRYHVWKVIRPDTGRDDVSVMTEISAQLSRGILAYPEQWLWGSRRFQTRPEGEVPGPDGLPPLV